MHVSRPAVALPEGTHNSVVLWATELSALSPSLPELAQPSSIPAGIQDRPQSQDGVHRGEVETCVSACLVPSPASCRVSPLTTHP